MALVANHIYVYPRSSSGPNHQYKRIVSCISKDDSGDRRGGLSGLASVRAAAGAWQRRRLRRQFLHRRQAQYRASARPPALRTAAARRDVSALCRGRRDLQSRLSGFARPLPARSGADHQDQRARRHQHARPRQAAAAPRSCRPRPAKSMAIPNVHPQPEELLGQRQSDRPALLLRRRQALRRNPVLRLSPPAQAAHQGGAHLQHLWPAHASQ